MASTTTKRATAIHPVGNGAAGMIEMEKPYVVSFTIEGTAALLFHRYDPDSVEKKGKAAKGSKAKKEDDVDSYVWRNEAGELCLPAEYIRQAMIEAARYKQDPRSPRKAARDLFKAGIVALAELASLGCKDWDYLDRRRARPNHAGAITRVRPALLAGWTATFTFQVLLPEYIGPALFQEVLENAGRLIGVADFRPTFGRFRVVRFEVLEA